MRAVCGWSAACSRCAPLQKRYLEVLLESGDRAGRLIEYGPQMGDGLGRGAGGDRKLRPRTVSREKSPYPGLGPDKPLPEPVGRGGMERQAQFPQ